MSKLQAMIAIGYGQPPGGYSAPPAPPAYSPAPAYGQAPAPGYGAPPAPMPYQGPPQKSKLPLFIMIFALLGVVMAGVSLATPWYNIHVEMGGSFMGITIGTKADTNMGFGGMDTSGTLMGATINNHTAWSDPQFDKMTATKGVFSMTMGLTVVALVMNILLLLGAFMLMKGGGKKLAMIFALMALIFNIVAPMVFMATLPGAINSDGSYSSSTSNTGPNKSFTGSTSTDVLGTSMKMSWGPTTGWMMCIVAFVFALLGFIMIMMLKQPGSAVRGPDPMPAAPAPAYAMQPQGQYPPAAPAYNPPPAQPDMGYQPPPGSYTPPPSPPGAQGYSPPPSPPGYGGPPSPPGYQQPPGY